MLSANKLGKSSGALWFGNAVWDAPRRSPRAPNAVASPHRAIPTASAATCMQQSAACKNGNEQLSNPRFCTALVKLLSQSQKIRCLKKQWQNDYTERALDVSHLHCSLGRAIPTYTSENAQKLGNALLMPGILMPSHPSSTPEISCTDHEVCHWPAVLQAGPAISRAPAIRKSFLYQLLICPVKCSLSSKYIMVGLDDL